MLSKTWHRAAATACPRIRSSCWLTMPMYRRTWFSYEVRKGRSGEYTKELWIDRRENSKSLAWSSVLLALSNVKEVGAVVDRPKALGDIRGVTYIYGMFYRFGVIDVPDDAKCKMNKSRCASKNWYTVAYRCNCRVIRHICFISNKSSPVSHSIPQKYFRWNFSKTGSRGAHLGRANAPGPGRSEECTRYHMKNVCA